MPYSIDPLASGVRGVIRWGHTSWSLCVGAGITLGMLPSWQELARVVLQRALDRPFDATEFQELIKQTGWQFDAWIQCAVNAWLDSGRDEASFAAEVEAALYHDLRQTARLAELEIGLSHAFQEAHAVRKSAQAKLLSFFRHSFSNSSVLQVAEFLAAAVAADRSPAAVLTFNYDTILETLLRLFDLAPAPAQPPVAAFKRVTSPPSWNAEGKTPIYYLHGCITPEPALTKRESRVRRRDRRDAVIAPEGSYLRLAGSHYTWPQTTFLYHANVDNLLLIGHSLSDPNLRRWLAWSYETRLRYASKRKPPHIWLRKRPATVNQIAVFENATAHLGVRIAWLNSWDDVGVALRNLVGIP